MKRRTFTKCLSAILVLCMTLSCVSFSFATVGAATVDEQTTEAVSSGSTDDNFSWDNATVYFLLTDRFKNGNTSNDHSYNRGLDESGNVVSNIDTRGTFHGGDFAGVTQTIEEGYFEDLGVNALWISAPYEQIHGYVVGDNSSSSFAHYSYHGYYVLDYTQTDANFGTAEEFETMVDTAHEHGLRVIIDIVLNHAGYNSVYDMVEYGYGTVKSGWESSYFSHQGINNTTYHSFIDYDSSASDWAKWWGTSWIRCGVAGYTAGGGDNYTMSLSGLPDFKTESSSTAGIPEILKTKWNKEGRYTQEVNELNSYLSSKGKAQTVTNSISYWLSTWVRDYGVDGFRCDTAKHVEYASWNTLKQTCVEALEEWRANNPDKPGADWDEDFWMTGEHWDHGVYKDEYYTQGGFDSMINFTTQGGGLLTSSRISDVYNGYANSINTDDSFNVLSYLSSHDSTLARGSLIPTGSAFLLLPGGVQIFYGDETNRPYVSGIGNDGNGGAGHSLRSDMNWDSIDSSVLAHWQKVGTFRNNHISVGAGANTDLTTTSGYAFGRTYSKNGVTDKVAGCIYASANTNVTIDVSSLWADGQQLMNAYDQSSAVVQNGKVTFNSGANSTILIQEPDGRPLMSVSGNATFSGSQTLTVTLEECETAKCSIDGGNKFIVKDGSTFVIGSTGYDGDTIEVVLEAENEKGVSTATYTFKKVAQGSVIETTTGATTPVEKAKLTVETWDGSAPYAYVWTGTSTALCGEWPGTKLTQKDADGNYYVELDTTEKYNVVLNNGSGTQSGDITGLSGATTIKVTNSSYSTTVVSTGTGSGSSGGSSEPTEDSVIIRVKSFDGSAPNLYVWDDTDKSINGAWPGSKLTQKDEDGNYILTIANKSSVNAIVNNGSGGQTGDITGIKGDVTITITDAGCTSYKMVENEVPLSGAALLRKEAREVKAWTSTDYTPSSWSAVEELMPSVDALVALGSDADETQVESMISKLQSAKSKLVLVSAKLSYAVVGKSTVTGIAVADADVAVTIGSKTYKVVSDDVTGAFTVTGATVSASSVINVVVTRNDYSSAVYSYNMANGNITNGEEPTSPTVPTATTPAPTTQPTTAAPTTIAPPTTQPTTTEPTTAPVTDELKVNATSNIFPAASSTFNKDEGTVTVSYKLTSSLDVVNTQWILSYDTSKLEFVASNNVSGNVQTITPVAGSQLVYKARDGKIKGNFTNLNMFSFADNEEFVTVTFNIIGTGSTDVYLDLEILSVGYFDDDYQTIDASIVDYSVMQDISGIKGFENATISTSTEVYNDIEYLLGDVNGDGYIKIDDVTTVLKYIVNLDTLNSVQRKAADCDGDGKITVKDATYIQKIIARLI